MNEGDVRAFLLDFGLAKRDTDRNQQESDVIDIVATALEVISDSEHLSRFRWKLNKSSILNKVTNLLHQALENGDLNIC